MIQLISKKKLKSAITVIFLNLIITFHLFNCKTFIVGVPVKIYSPKFHRILVYVHLLPYHVYLFSHFIRNWRIADLKPITGDMRSFRFASITVTLPAFGWRKPLSLHRPPLALVRGAALVSRCIA